MNTAVLVSGGVDSSVALARLSRHGSSGLTAFYLKIWLEDEMSHMGDCPWEEDLRYAREVCRKLSVPIEVVSLQKEYYERVVSYTVSELKAGRTPSPDILCNQRIKFGAFFDRIGPGFDRVATGHYARTGEADGSTLLYCAPDPVKDQTYFLSHLSQDQLGRAIFPLGNSAKSVIREEAEALELPNRNRPDSQGICFLGRIRYPEFVRYYLGEKQGEIVEYGTGQVLGQHRGVWFYTIGQRQGLGLSGGPWYVVSKDLELNTVFVSHALHVAGAAQDRCIVTGLNWIPEPPGTGRMEVKLRHGPERRGCRIRPLQNGSQNGPGRSDRVAGPASDRWELLLDTPDRGIAPGQFAVFYEDDRCLGGGVIE